jgi:hypothetical protein
MPKKAGRPTKADGDKKSHHLSIRISGKLRGQLEETRRRSEHAQKKSVSLSEHVEQLLWQALTAEREIEKRLGGPTTSAFLSIVADGISTVQGHLDGEHWLDNPFVYGQVREMLDDMLDRRRPRGRRVLPENIRRWPALLKEDAGKIGRKTALRLLSLLDAAGNAREEAPPSESRPSKHYFDKPLARGLRGSPLAELQKHRQRVKRRADAAGEVAIGRKMDALSARSITIGVLVSYLLPRLIKGAKMANMAKVFDGITGVNFGEKKPVIIERLKSATKGRLIEHPGIDLDRDVARILDHAAVGEVGGDLTISDDQHHAMQRRAVKAEAEETKGERR